MQLRYFLWVFGLMLAITSFSQKFTPEPEKFWKEMQTFLGQTNKADAKAFAKEFELDWLTVGRITESQKALIYAAANDIATQRRPPYPDFKDYMVTVLYANRAGVKGDQFAEMHATIEKTLESKKRQNFTNYIRTTAGLMKDGFIATSSSTKWRARKGSYSFSYDKQPIITFKDINLICYSKNDSSVLYKTSGEFQPFKNKWYGEGGTLTWERAELPKDKTYAVLSKYDIGMKSPSYTADSVLFTTPYFKEPVKGRIIEKVVSNRGVRQVAFPKFSSYDQRLSIPQIFPNVDYEGGFTISGNSLEGTGTFENPCKMVFYYKDEEFITATSLTFVIGSESASADRAKINMKIEDDSIIHPGVLFTFNAKNDQQSIRFTRGQGITSAPFRNTYHNLDMYPESINWKMGDPIVNLEPLFGSTDTSAAFVSGNYFAPGIYDRLTGMGTNPLTSLAQKSRELKKNDLTTREAAMALMSGPKDVEPVLYDLMVGGFLNFDIERDNVHLNDKLFNYIRQRSKKKDYDDITFESLSKRNAELSLVSKDLTIKGVRKVPLSNTQFTMIYPDKQTVIVKKGLDILFGGIINSGRTEYFGNQFTFDYLDFKLNLIECDSMRIRPNNPRRDPRIPLRMGSKIEAISGNIQIDKAENKSGNDTINKEYPLLTCNKKSYVYYDDKSIQKGAYKRDEFKFIIEPFVMDSLDNFKNSGLAFDGEFISAGIFPNMDETLTIQDDYSLGFIRKAPKGGVGIYGEKANYENEIRLSNKGLQGSGEIDFLSSHATSTEITFFPDSLNAIAENYVNTGSEDEPEVPEVTGSKVYVSYIPDQKVLYAASRDDNQLLMYGDSTARLEGRLALRPQGMTGYGRMFIENGEVLSNKFRYKNTVIDADTAEFKLRTVDLDEMAFKTENVQAHIDFKDRKGQFKSNEGESFVEFPENQYICYMDQFNWLMDQDDLEMESKEKGNVNIDTDLDLAGSNFFSIHPKQDSLQFRSPKAKFDVRKKLLTCNEVEFIEVADARIFPSDGIVLIKKKAKMDPFKDAKIVANSITKYHNIFDAEVSIYARKDYVASGYYNYVDESQTQQKFYFSNIKPDTSYQTTAKGSVKEEDGFKLSPQFDYYGDIEMKASYKELTFTGDVRLSAHDCKGIERNWMSFTAAIDPEDIYIPVAAEMKDSKGQSIGAGMILNTDDISLYSTFLSNKKSIKHIDVLKADGFLRYDKDSKEYRISSKEKLTEINLPGNYVSLNTKDCSVKGDGQFDFGCEFGLFEMSPVGTIDYDPNKDKLNMKASIAFKFPFNDVALEKMAKQFEDFPDLPPLDFNNSTYEKSLREIVGLEKSDKLISDLNIYGKIKGKFPEELLSQLYLADVEFVWDPERRSYVSQGKLGIATTGKKQMFKQIDGKIAIMKKPTGDEISILLKLDDKTYYFFNYKRGVFQTYSSNEEFNTTIAETKKDKTKFNAPKGKEDFQFMLGSKTKAIAFERMFE